MKSEFPIRSYGKSELALLYFPTATSKHTAVSHLMSWIRRCAPLNDELYDNGYRPTNKLFSAREVRLITQYLGDP